MKIADSYVCSCVGLKFERAFSTHLSPALKRSSLALNAFFPRAKTVCLQRNKRVRLLFGRWFRKPRKITETNGKVSLSLISVKDGAEEKDRNKVEMNMQEVYRLPYICCAFLQMSGIFLCSFNSTLFLSFIQRHP